MGETFTTVIYKCGYCFHTLRQQLQLVNYTRKTFIKLTPGENEKIW